MQLRFISRGIIPPALFILTLSFAQTPVNPPVYAAIGPEAPAILRVLVGNASVATVQAGEFANLLQQQSVKALVVPQEWAGSNDLQTARAAQIEVVRLKREVSVATVEDNIRTLGTLTDSSSEAATWIRSINLGLNQIASALRGVAATRVLILTPEGYTEGQGAFITEMINLAGGINVAAKAGIPEARQIDDSQVRQFAPDVVLLVGDWSPTNTQYLTSNPVYHGIAAFDRSRVYPIASPGKDPAHLVADVQTLVNLLHPALF